MFSLRFYFPLVTCHHYDKPFITFFFPLIFLHLCCFHFTDETQNACKDLLTGASRIRAMLHNEQTDQFYLLTSGGHIFIEPISNFDTASSPPILTLTEAKYSMPRDWNINKHPETISADSEEFLTFWVNPNNRTETLLNNIWQNANSICAYPGVKLDGEKYQVEMATGRCALIREETRPEFWLGFKSQSYGMVKSSGRYCRIYYFPDGKNDNLRSSSTLVYNSECLGVALEEGNPQCGVVHKEADVAVVIQDTSTVYVYRKFFPSGDKNRLNDKQEIPNLQPPTKHQINEFIKCKAKTNLNEKQKNVNKEKPDGKPKPDKPKPDKPKADKPKQNMTMKQKLFLIFFGVLFLVAIVFGLVVKFKLIQGFPWKRKRKGKTMEKISQAYSIAISKAISKASVVPRESALQQMRQKASLFGKVKKKPANKQAETPGVVMKTLEKIKRRLVNTVKAAKKPKTKRKKKKGG